MQHLRGGLTAIVLAGFLLLIPGLLLPGLVTSNGVPARSASAPCVT